MLRTKQILDNSKYTQESNSVLGLSGKTEINDVSLFSNYSLDTKSISYSNNFFSKKYSPKHSSFFSSWIFDDTKLPTTEKLVDIHPIFDNGDFTSSQNIFVLGQDGDTESEIYEFGTDEFTNFYAEVYSKTSNNYQGDVIPSNIVASVYVPEHGSIYYVYDTNIDAVDNTGLGCFNITGLTNTLYSSSSGNYSGDLILNVTSNTSSAVKKVITSYNDNGNIFLYFIFSARLHRFNATTKTNQIYYSSSGNYSGTTLSSSIEYPFQNGNHLYVCLNHFFVSSGGIWRLDLSANTAVKFTTTSNNYSGETFTSNSIRKVIKDVNGFLWFQTGNGIWRYDETNNTGTNFTSLTSNYNGDKISSPSNLIKKSDDVLAFQDTSRNLYEFDITTLTVTKYTSLNSPTVNLLLHTDQYISNYPLLEVIFTPNNYVLQDFSNNTNYRNNGMFAATTNSATGVQSLSFGLADSNRYLGGVISNIDATEFSFINKNFLDNYLVFGNGFNVTPLHGFKYLEITGGSSSSIVTVGNGLTQSNGVILLGGTLTGNTTIDYGTTNFNIKSTSSGKISLESSGVDSTKGIFITDLEDGKISLSLQKTGNQISLDSQGVTISNGFQNRISLTNSWSNSNITLDSTSGISITSLGGAVYTADYSNSFTKYSLVDKHYVTGITSQITVGSGTGNTSWPNSDGNIIIGVQNLTEVTASTRSIVIGFDNSNSPSRTEAHNNVSIGNSIGNTDYNYSNSIDIGYNVCNESKSLEGSEFANSSHIAIGNWAMYQLTGTSVVGGMIAIGSAMQKAISRDGGSSIAIGSALGLSDFEMYTIAIGNAAGNNAVIGRGNTLIGTLAGANMSGGTAGPVGTGTVQFNVAIGTHTLENGSGEKGTFVGCEAGSQKIRGQANSGFGNWSLPRATGNYNNGLGSFAGYHASLTLTGSTNTFIGWRSGYSTASLTNTIVLAHNYEASLSNRVYLGATTQKVILTATPTNGSNSEDVLLRNTSTGEIETRTPSSLIDGIAWKTTGTTTIASTSFINIPTGVTLGFITEGTGSIFGVADSAFNSELFFQQTSDDVEITLTASMIDGSGHQRFKLDPSATVGALFDQFPLKGGIQYGGDYSSSFTDRSLIDKQYNDKQKLRSFTVAGVPSAATEGAGTMIYVTDEIGGSIPAFSDGTNWRRVSDRAIISV